MTIREQIEIVELGTLCEDACTSKHTGIRREQEAKCPIRTDFQRDRDRILHCNSFRRLKHKTQVFLDPVGDHYRTRLTHSLEVAQIARTISRALRLNEDLTEAIALGHDLGHTPFGHAGEAALNEIADCGFKHYLQSVRVVDYIERNGKGLNLTYEVKNGIATHTDKMACTKEGYIVRVADKIAYINHDIDDAIRAGVLTEEDLPEHPVNILGHSKSERITSCIMSIVNNGVKEIKMAPDITAAQDELHSFMFERVYRNPAAKSEEQKAKTLVQRLFQYYMKSPEKLPQLYKDIAERFSKERAVCDYISGMSDSYAVNLYKDIFIPRSWAVK
ncbi:MAG: deoxyguanosinetriphosphate triphosphohydrolase [Oscillospiraceae bacterium]|nr:deoxyguanosinetriphosphate triphosphohydrolase [Oscillospiraceae bacterium]MBQ4487535.1 deoxyguanosinetriphosphate triphosphohydrolase [Oscillospiraceae bacterium]MCR5806002.1 deoxyguanosinetriphosphate triphosphohydrolase [Oscillospiraceae bacterium]